MVPFLTAYFPNGESPKNVSDVTLPVFRSRTVTVVIVQAVNRDALVVRNGNVQRPNQFARVISVVHASFSLSDCAAHEHDHSRSKFWATPMLKREDSGGGTRGIAADAPVFGGRAA